MTRLPVTAQILLIYAASRVFSTALLLAMFQLAHVNHWAFGSQRLGRDFFAFSGSWDGSYYRRIIEHGYPSTLPLDSAHAVLPNEWAFLPVFPWLVKAMTTVTGIPSPVASVVVSLLAGAGAALVLHRLVSIRASRTVALCTVVLFCFGPLAFILQVAYAESLFLLLIFAGLFALTTRRYGLLVTVAVLASFTRPGALALALALAIHGLIRLVSADPFPWRERVKVIAAGMVIALAGLSWPLIAAAATGDRDAYLNTELSWWIPLVGEQRFVPLTPWFILGIRYLGIAGIAVVVLVMAGFFRALSRRSMRALGSDTIAFSASYGLYLFAAFLPQQSILRLLMPLAPLAANERLWQSRARCWTVLGIGAALQPVAIVLLWFIGFP